MPPAAEPLTPKIISDYTFSGLRLHEVKAPEGHVHPLHTHKEAFIDLCIEGAFSTWSGKKPVVRTAASVIYFPAGAPHATRSEAPVRTFQAVIPASWIERMAEIAPLAGMVTQHDAGPATWLADRLYREYVQRDSFAPLVLEGILMQMIAEFSRNPHPLQETGGARSVRAAQDFIHAHFTADLSIEAIAAAAGVHPSHLMRSFRRIQGCTVGDYIRQLRIEEACRMLQSSAEPLAQIAVSLGFVDQSHFTRTFKAHIGQTPAQFQNCFAPQLTYHLG